MKTTKPPYRVPLMAEINEAPLNGYNVMSTFSGCGGSCTGYRMAGYRVLWMNEFVEEAQRSYAANHPETIVDGRDIKTVNPYEVLRAVGLAPGELDIFDGSPPCQGFSMANKNRMKGKAKTYENGVTQKNEELFFAYVKLLKVFQPKVFVAENVRGLLVGKAKELLGDFQREMFVSQKDTILDAFMDAGYVVRYALLNAADYGTPQSRPRAIFVGVRKDLHDRLGLEPCFPKKLGHRFTVRDALPWIDKQSWKDGPPPRPTRGAVLWDGGNPPPVDKAAWIDKGWGVAGWDSIKPGEQHEQHFSMVKVHPDKPCPTILASHGGGLIGVVHPFERRKFSIAELRRLGGFPDDYVLTGKYAQQWERVGNSVPPTLMFRIAQTIRRNILSKIPKDYVYAR